MDKKTIEPETRARLKHFMAVLDTLPIGGVPFDEDSELEPKASVKKSARSNGLRRLKPRKLKVLTETNSIKSSRRQKVEESICSSNDKPAASTLPYLFDNPFARGFGMAANES
jgi:hypothetical protein